MDELLIEIQKMLDALVTSPKYKEILTFDRVEYSKSNGSFFVYLETGRHLHPVEYCKTLQKIKAEYEKKNILIFLAQNRFVQDFLSDKNLLQIYIKDFLVYKKQTFLPFIGNLEVSMRENLMQLIFRDDFAYGFFSKLALDELIKQYLLEAYSLEYTVQTLLAEAENMPSAPKEDYMPSFDLARELQINKKRPPEAALQPTAQASSKPAYQEDRKGRSRTTRLVKDVAGPITSISELLPGMEYIVSGEVVFMETVSLKDGKYMKYKFGVYDKSGTVICWFIERAEAASKPSEGLKKGVFLKVSGSYYYEKYEHDNAIAVSELCHIQPVAKKDNAQVKRVELHLHTTMSAQDAVSDVKSLIARAADYGHPAIAITDHGVVQAFPFASGAAKAKGIKLIYGCEGYLANDGKNIYEPDTPFPFTGEFVVFDIETTGLSYHTCEITEIGAVRIMNGEIKDHFKTFVSTSNPIPPNIVALTGITDDMLAGAPTPVEALQAFSEFCGSALLVAHNAAFDTGFIFHKSKENNILFENDYIDSIALCKIAFPELGRYKLNIVAKHLKISLEHHRAVNDAIATARIVLACFHEFEKQGISDLKALNDLCRIKANVKNMEMFHIVLLCKNKTGLINLYRLVSDAHINHYYKKPRMLKSLIQKYREGLIIGSACEQGELYRAIITGKDPQTIRKIASFYDYFEIQPLENNMFLIKKGEAKDVDDLKRMNRQIYELGLEMGKPVVATCDVHFLEKEDAIYRKIIFHTLGFEDAEQTPLYFRSTDEMLEAFSYLGEDEAYDVVVENTNKIAAQVEEIELFQKETAMPFVEGADDEILASAYETAYRIYGDPLPELIEARLKRELDSIINNGFGILYWAAARLVKKSLSDGYLVGSRGSVGSSFAATMMGITEVNPLSPHYICPVCKHSDFDVDKTLYTCGVDLPPKTCPECGNEYRRDGFDIPFEVFLGINADKVPDIDLNFSGEYQPNAHKYTEELFGADNVFRAGTISSIKDKTAYGYVKKYLDETNKVANAAEINRLVEGISGVKRTTGQHPGGMVIVPKDREIYEFTAVQKPADSEEANTITTHFDFNSMHDILIKLDILGHDVPTIIRHLQDITGMDPLEIPLNDKDTMRLFSSLDPLGLTADQMPGIEVGTLGIPEFGTKFVRQMLKQTLPTTMEELVRISGLSHGTDVWLGNAQDLIADGTATLKECICTRDDIMNYLVSCGVEKRQAFFTMENVRKGKGLKEEMENAMIEANVPEWFINSCKKIKYMFPKGHAVAYTVMSLRIAYCKMHYPLAFYATYFTVRSNEFDCSYVLEGKEGILKNIQMLEAKGKTATANEKNMITILEVANEMYQRGMVFLPIDLAKSDARKFVIENNGLRLPFLSVPKLGENAAQCLAESREQGTFISIEDLKSRAKLSSSVIEEMQKMGALAGITATNQISMFDL